MPLLTNAGPSLVRLPDWQPRFSAFLRERRSLPYEYGVTDCACFAVDAVRVVTGTDLAPGVERPRSAIEGGRFLVAHGVRTIEELFAGTLGTPWEHLGQGRRGDLASFFAAGETHMALVTGVAAVTPGPSGLVTVPSSLWRRAWRIG